MSADVDGRPEWDVLSSWGIESRMNDLEALMWRGERHPEFSSCGVVLEVFRSVPDWDRFRTAHEWGVSMVPRLRCRVVEPALPLGPPAWMADPEFDLDHHLRRAELPAPAGEAELLTFAQEIGLAPMDRARPLWQGTLVELSGKRAAYIFKSHHCLMDGAGVIALFSALHSRTSRPTRGKPTGGAAPPPDVDRYALTVADLAGQVVGAPRQAVRLLSSAVRAFAAPGEAVEFLGSMRRVLSPPAGTAPSPLQSRQQGRDWRYGTVDCSLADLKAAAKAAGGSLNDAYMAALLGGLRRYHAALGLDVADIPIAMPVSIRRPEDGPGGNRFAGALFGGPAGEPDPVERIAAIRGAVLSVRAEPALDVLGVISPFMSRLPSAALGLALGAVPRVDLSGSNVPGLTRPAYAAGARVDRMYVFGPLPNASMLSTLCSYAGTCCIGINADGAVFADTDLLWASMRDGLAEVLALGLPADGGAP